MPAAEEDTKSLTNAWRKTNEQQLFTELETDYGFSRAMSRSLVHLMHEHIEANYGNLRNDSQIIYHAVSADEPPGKSLDHLRLVSVTLTISEPGDADILNFRALVGENTNYSGSPMRHMIGGPPDPGGSGVTPYHQYTHNPTGYAGDERTEHRGTYPWLNPGHRTHRIP